MVTPGKIPDFNTKAEIWSKEIIDEYLQSSVHELQKRISMVTQKDQDLSNRLSLHEKRSKEFREIHQNHRMEVPKRDASTQTLTYSELKYCLNG